MAAVHLGDDCEAPMLVNEVFPERSSLCGLLVQPALLADTETTAVSGISFTLSRLG